MSRYPVSREGWPCIFLHPSEFSAADRAGYVKREPDRMVLSHPDLLFSAIIHIVRPIPRQEEVAPVEPHDYAPSTMHMGDCAVCGHLQESPLHLPRVKLHDWNRRLL